VIVHLDCGEAHGRQHISYNVGVVAKPASPHNMHVSVLGSVAGVALGDDEAGSGDAALRLYEKRLARRRWGAPIAER